MPDFSTVYLFILNDPLNLPVTHSSHWSLHLDQNTWKTGTVMRSSPKLCWSKAEAVATTQKRHFWLLVHGVVASKARKREVLRVDLAIANKAELWLNLLRGLTPAEMHRSVRYRCWKEFYDIVWYCRIRNITVFILKQANINKAFGQNTETRVLQGINK